MIVTGRVTTSLFLFFILSFCCSAQELHWYLKNYDKEQGLVQNTITAITEDVNGMIWVGTQNGVHKFDGYEFEVFNRNAGKNGSGLASDYIQNLTSDNSGQLWVGTSRGLHFYDNDTNVFVPFDHNTYDSAIQGLAVDHSGVLWVGANDGLYKVNQETGRLVRSGLKEKAVTAITPNDELLYLIVNGSQIVRYDLVNEKSEVIYSIPNNQNIYDVGVIEDTLIIATTHGLIRLKNQVATKVAEEKITSAIALNVNLNNQLWISTGSQIFQINDVHLSTPIVKHVSSNHDLKQIISLYVDSNRLIWLGTQNEGLFLHGLNSQWIETIGQGDGSAKDLATIGMSVTALDKTSEANVWQGSNQGIAYLDVKSDKSKRYPLGELHSGIKSQSSVIKVDEEGNVWAGYRNGALTKFDANRGMFVSQTPDLKVFITDIIELDKYQLLFTTRDNGVFIFHKQTSKLKQFDNSSLVDVNWKTNRFQSSLPWTDSQVWLGSFDAGLFLFDFKSSTVLKRFHQSADTNPLNDNLVISLLNDDEKGIFIGTTSGLAYLDSISHKISFFDDVEHIKNQTIYCMERDELGFLWLTTNNGIVRFDPAKRRSRLFNSEDGLPNNEFNSNAMVHVDNFIFAGGVKGLAKLDYLSVPAAGGPPKVLLTDFYLAGKLIDVADESSPIDKALDQMGTIELNYMENGFSIGFLAINYQTPLKVRYQYKLEPFDSNWIEVDHRRRLATYTNLDPGKYSFKVKASVDGITWGAPKTAYLVISPAPWRSAWAYTFYVFALIGSVAFIAFFAHRKREFERQSFEKIREKEQELSLALWGSGDEFWNYNVEENKLLRRNSLTTANYLEIQSGDEFEATIHPDDLRKVIKALSSCILQNVSTFELTYRLKNIEGDWSWVLGKGQVSGRDPETGRPTLISGANKNIDNLKKAQEALSLANDQLEDKVKERTKELVEANNEITQTLKKLENTQQRLVESEKMASLGNMVAGIAHEINTPLGVAITSLSHSESVVKDLLKSAKDKTLTATKFSHLGNDLQAGMELAQRNLGRAGELVNSFKQVSVDQSSEQSRDFDLEKLLKDTVNTLKPKLKNTDIEVHLEVQTEITMTSYPGALTQVLLNFMTNSITHGFKSTNSGQIEIRAFLNGESSVLLIYRDTGSGIDEAHWEKVFEPFFTTNRNAGNTGLGMHISYNLVTQKLNGEILLNSREGAGVEFYIHLPLSVEENKIVLPMK